MHGDNELKEESKPPAAQEETNATLAPDTSPQMISRYVKARVIYILLMFFATIVASVGITIFVFLTYFYRPVVVLDLKEIVSYVQAKSQKMDQDAAIKMVGTYFDDMTKSIQSRKEIVLVKEAVLNAEQFKDITAEYKK
ncbi:MAG TPA: hypothetical protein DCP92_17040 [Nitrospiraceae bacterium]|jgi:hypothetical protein|nr:hypothetical protein [Nitrospiraceae bacterium]